MLFDFVLTLFKQPVKIYQFAIKTCFQRDFELKNFICKEKCGNVKKVKLVTKIKKHIQLYFGTLVLASYCYWVVNA